MSFQLVGASHIGVRHHERHENNQDSFRIGELHEHGVRYGVALDGCGSSLHSEVSVLYTYMLVQKIEEFVHYGDLPYTELPGFLFTQSIEFLNMQIKAVGLDIDKDRDQVAKFVREYWLFTVLAFVQFPSETLILHRGDGVIRVNQFVYAIDEGNRPQYLGYFAIPWSVPEEVIQKPGFNVLTLETQDVDALLLGTDGWNSHTSVFRILEEKADSSESLQMFMNALVFNEEAFEDDATVVGLIRKD